MHSKYLAKFREILPENLFEEQKLETLKSIEALAEIILKAFMNK